MVGKSGSSIHMRCLAFARVSKKGKAAPKSPTPQSAWERRENRGINTPEIRECIEAKTTKMESYEKNKKKSQCGRSHLQAFLSSDARIVFV
jgi:hypothetical protein